MSEPGPIVVAFQGEPGAYSEQAALELLGSDAIETRGLDSFDKCFKAVQDGSATFAMLPIENSLGGTIHANYDLQLRHEFFIVAEHDFRVRHCLLAMPGVGAANVDKVLSHPQALAQCDGYLRGRNLEGQSSYDTAGSAKMIAENKDGSLGKSAAIASALAATRYGLEILEEGIEDDDNNFTRFLLLSRRWLPLERGPAAAVAWKTTMVFSLINQPGCLVKALSAFSFRDVSLTKLESRPNKLRLKGRSLVPTGLSDEQQIPAEDRELLERLKFPELEQGLVGAAAEADGAADEDEQRFQAVFYVDCTGSLADPRVQNALRHLSELATFLRILGSYPKDSVLRDFVAEAMGVPSGMRLLEARAAGAQAQQQTQLAEGSRTRLKVGIIGFGNFGQFLAKTFTRHADVYACSRSDYSGLAREMGVGFAADLEGMVALCGGALDCLVVSVSILSFEAVVRRLPAQLLEGLLVVDVLSVKTLPKNALQVLLPASADILCTHPMFGPESGKFSWRGLPCVYEKVRIRDRAAGDRRCERFLDLFRKPGCRMVEMSCEMHDEAAAGSQFVTHFTGRVLGELRLQSTPINTKGFETLLALVDNTCKDSFDLFEALYKCNPHSSQQLEALHEAMARITGQLQSAEKSKEAEGAGESAGTRLSAFVNRIQQSKTAETHGRAMELLRQGKDIVTTLTVGEPDFKPPQPILDAAAAALREGRTGYTPVGGLFDLKQAIADDYARRKGVSYDPSGQVLITHGGKQAIFCAVLSVCDRGDEVVIPAPYWVSYPEITRLSGAEPVIVDRRPEDDYILGPEQLEAALTPRTRLLILCNPCNPTGALYSPEQLEALAAVLRKPQYSRVLVLSDEIYERLAYDGRSHVSFAALPGMKERTILVNGFAKGFAMTGFRLGWLATPDEAVVAAALKLQSQINACPCSISQHAGIAALRDVPEEMLAPLYKGLEDKRDAVVRLMQAIPNVLCPTPRGAFYVFPNVSHYLGKTSAATGRKVDTSTDLCNYLIEEHGLALPPGDAFGAPAGVRFSYATSMPEIEKAVERFRAGLAGLT